MSETVRDDISAAYARLVEEKSLSPRRGQRQMIATVANSLLRLEEPDGELAPHCVIEAGTGTGKTIAYTVAAIPVAQALGKSLVIATATVALQEQLVHKDLPDIRRHSGLEFDAALAKGRRRYICLSRLQKVLATGGEQDGTLPLYPDEMDKPRPGDALPVYTRMAEALDRDEWDGDRDNWRGELLETVWTGVTTDHSQCSGRRCPNVSRCSFYRARDALQNADVIVTNHDLVLSDLALGGGAILPPPGDTIYIIDEGHHLPDKALNHFAAACHVGGARQWLTECAAQLKQAAGAPGAPPDMVQEVARHTPLLEQLSELMQQVDQLVPGLVPDESPQRWERRHHRFPGGAVPAELQAPATDLARLFKRWHVRLQKLEQYVQKLLEGAVPGFDAGEAENWHAVFGAMLTRAGGNVALWEDYAAAPAAGSSPNVSSPDASFSNARDDAPIARWINIIPTEGRTGYELRSSPVLAAAILREQLWQQAAAVVATSATMTALNSFERFILRSGAPRNSSFEVVSSPFAWDRAELRVPAMDCDPKDAPAHTAALVEKLPAWLDPDAGSLVLFSSRRQMSDVYEGLPEEWRERILVQGERGKAEMLRMHREAIDAGGGSVLFGLASFAEGVDLPGPYCEHVLIAKIPFAVPDSPIESALGEWVKARGGNDFMEISVPDASLRLVQAAGRLLRTEEDTGRVTICDRRLVTKAYGRALLDALPPFRRYIEQGTEQGTEQGIEREAEREF